jgi:hypothetical protein
VFNTVDKGQVMVDCTGDPYEVGPETIVHMDNKDLHTMLFIPIKNATRDFLANIGDISGVDEYVSCEARINSCTW